MLKMGFVDLDVEFLVLLLELLWKLFIVICDIFICKVFDWVINIIGFEIKKLNYFKYI